MDTIEIGRRLRSFLIEKYGKLKTGADKLGMKPQTLQKYLNGDYIPGGKIISKLKELGCDTDWLLLTVRYPTQPERILTGDEITVKDKIILNQAEEILKLKDEVRRLETKFKEIKTDSDEIEKSIKEVNGVKSKKKRKD